MEQKVNFNFILKIKFYILVLTENLLSLYILNDNIKIKKLLRKLLSIYSRSIKKIKLIYFLRYYHNVVLSDYKKYEKLNNMFRRKRQKYFNSSENYENNYNSQNLNNNNNNYDFNNNFYKTISIPYQYSYILNNSEPIIIRNPINNMHKMAFLMTPCYIMDNNDPNNKCIKEYNDKNNNKDINKGHFTSRHKYQTLRQKSEILDSDYIYDKLINNKENINSNIRNMRKNYNIKKIWLPSNKSEIFEKNIKNKNKNIGNNRNNFEFKRSISTERIKNNKNMKHFLFDDEEEEENIDLPNNKNMTNLYFLVNKKNDNSKKKNIKKIKNKNNSSNIFDDIDSLISGKTRPDKNKINREIFSNLYKNNNLNNLRKLDYKKIKKESNNKKRNDQGTYTERIQNKKYKIFNQIENKSKRIINDSHEYILQHSISNTRRQPYNKQLNKDAFSKTVIFSSNISGKNKNNFSKGTKKIIKNGSTSNNNNLNNSNSQSNNPNIKNISTNYSIGPVPYSNYQGNKDSQNLKKSCNEKDKINNKKNPNWKIEYGNEEESFKDNLEKNSSVSNRISLQTMNDSKMMELAGYYVNEESSSDNYKMNNIVHSKKKFSRKIKNK